MLSDILSDPYKHALKQHMSECWKTLGCSISEQTIKHLKQDTFRVALKGNRNMPPVEVCTFRYTLHCEKELVT